MAFLFADRVRVNTTTTGTGTINLGTAVSGFRTFSTAVTAGSLTSGCSIYYVVEDINGTWEIGSGVYTVGSPDTLTRTVAASSLGGTTALTLSGQAQVCLTITAATLSNTFVLSNQARNTKTANYTLVLSDASSCIEMNSTSATTVTIPPSGTVAFPLGAYIDVYQMNTGRVTIAAGGGVTIVTPSTLVLAGQYSVVRLQNRATDVWILQGGELQPMPQNQAQRVGDFLNSLGVNTQIASYETPYGSYATLLANLQYIGATAIRDRLATSAGDPAITNNYINLAASGIKLDLYSPTAEDTPTAVVADCITSANNIQEAVTNAIICIESPNEPPSTNYVYSGSTSSPTASPGFLPVANFMAALYTAVKQNAYLNSVPLLTVSLGGADFLDDGLQFLYVPTGYSHNTLTTNGSTSTSSAILHFASVPLTGTGQIVAGLYVYDVSTPASIGNNVTVVSATSTTVTMSSNASATIASGQSIRFGARVPDQTLFADILNCHIYPMYGANFGSGAVYSAASIDPTLGNFFTQGIKDNFVTPNGSSGATGYSLATASALPKWITEFGYATAGATAGGSAVDQTTQGKNNLTAWLNAWQAGFARFFIYSLTDDQSGPGSSNSFGLYSFTWTAKSSATWLHNFITILADTTFNRNSFSASALPYVITNLPTGGTSQLFQASNGMFFLVLWNNINNWNVATGAPITIGSTSVTVTFGRQGAITAYDPTISTSAQQTLTSNVVVISLTDYPQIISFV